MRCAHSLPRRRSARFLPRIPTEVRRKSTIDREMEIASVLNIRDRTQMTADEIAASDEQLRRAVVTLWQTNL